jgi:hypothetical protein
MKDVGMTQEAESPGRWKFACKNCWWKHEFEEAALLASAPRAVALGNTTTDGTDPPMLEESEPEEIMRPPQLGFPWKGKTERLKETLALLQRSPHATNLIEFLVGKSATVREICKHLYKSVDKATVSKARQLIRRTTHCLEKREAPLRIAYDKASDRVRLVDHP